MGSGQNKLVLELYHALGRHFWQEGQVCESWTNSWSWSLICRAMNCAQITGTALSWHGDCIGVQYGKTKTDKQGKKTCLVKHVFANPFQPWVDKISATSCFYEFSATSFFDHLIPSDVICSAGLSFSLFGRYVDGVSLQRSAGKCQVTAPQQLQGVAGKDNQGQAVYMWRILSR